MPVIATWKLQSRSRRVIGHATHRPVNSLKARGESTSAGRLSACSLAMAWRKSSQMMSPTSGQWAVKLPGLVAAWFAPVDLLRHVFLGHSSQQFLQSIGRLPLGPPDRPQYQRAILNCDLGMSTHTHFECLCHGFRNPHREAVAPFAELNEHGNLLLVDTLYRLNR